MTADKPIVRPDYFDRTPGQLLEENDKLKRDLAAALKSKEKAEENYRWMVEHSADRNLDGYRELGERAAIAENKLAAAHAALAEANSDIRFNSNMLATQSDIARGMEERAMKAEARIAVLEAALREAARFLYDNGWYAKAIKFMTVADGKSALEKTKEELGIVKAAPDADGHCNICGLLWPDRKLTLERHVCPPGFRAALGSGEGK